MQNVFWELADKFFELLVVLSGEDELNDTDISHIL